MKFWIIQHDHRHGVDSFPVFSEDYPTEDQIAETIASFGACFEPDEDETVELQGPFTVPEKTA